MSSSQPSKLSQSFLNPATAVTYGASSNVVTPSAKKEAQRQREHQANLQASHQAHVSTLQANSFAFLQKQIDDYRSLSAKHGLPPVGAATHSPGVRTTQQVGSRTYTSAGAGNPTSVPFTGSLAQAEAGWGSIL